MPTFPRFLREVALEEITKAHNVNVVPRRLAERALDKWEKGAPAERCIHRDEAPYFTDCQCTGCLERILFLYFEQAVQRLGFGTPK